MKSKSIKIVLYCSLILVVLAIIFFGGRYIVFNKIKQGILTQVDSLRKAGYDIRFDSLYSNAWKSSVGVKNLMVDFPRQGRCDDSLKSVKISRFEIHGFEILALVLHHELHVGHVNINSPVIHYHGKLKKTKKHSDKAEKIRAFRVDRLNLTDVKIMLYDSTSCAPSTLAQFDLQLSGLELKNAAETAAELLLSRADISKVHIQFPKQLYTLKIKNIAYRSDQRQFNVDSIVLMPDYDKATFARKRGTQTDRIKMILPLLEAHGVEVDWMGDRGLHAGQVDLSLFMEVFRDKRYPFVNKKIKILPIQFLHELKYRVQIDTLHLLKSDITYEEFPEQGDVAGKISFNELTAVVHNISNRSQDESVMQAHAKLMNAGDLKVSFTFPADPEKPYTMNGALTHFNLTAINPMLSPIGKVKIKSGMLNEMRFHSQYNNYRADGTLSMDYKDLNMEGLSKNTSENKSNAILTMLLQAFVKKDMDKEKRNGTILFYRDDHRAIFNYWWKSILSGIKSLFHLDKVTTTDRNKKK